MRSSSTMDMTKTNPRSYIRNIEEGSPILSAEPSLVTTGRWLKLVRFIQNFQILIFSFLLSLIELRMLINVLKMYQFPPLTLLKSSLMIRPVVNLTMQSLIWLVLIMSGADVSGTSKIFWIAIWSEMLMRFCLRKKLRHLWTGSKTQRNV